MMLNDKVGLVVNCGSWRLQKAVKSGSVMMSFALSVEVPESKTMKTADELRDAIQETVSKWSQASWLKQKRREKLCRK